MDEGERKEEKNPWHHEVQIVQVVLCVLWFALARGAAGPELAACNFVATRASTFWDSRTEGSRTAAA